MADKNHIGVDGEDWDDALKRVEQSYGIKFEGKELAHVRTLGDLLDAIVSKVSGTDSDDCTSQQSFYQIRRALEGELSIDVRSVHPGSELHILLPRSQRRSMVKKLERRLGVRMDILTTKNWVSFSLTAMLLGSLICFIWDSGLALKGIAAFILALLVANVTKQELQTRTLGDLAERLTQRAYKSMRRDPSTVNRKEIRVELKALLREEFGLEHDDLRDDILIVP